MGQRLIKTYKKGFLSPVVIITALLITTILPKSAYAYTLSCNNNNSSWNLYVNTSGNTATFTWYNNNAGSGDDPSLAGPGLFLYIADTNYNTILEQDISNSRSYTWNGQNGTYLTALVWYFGYTPIEVSGGCITFTLPSSSSGSQVINILPPANILPRVTPGGIIQAFIQLILITAFIVAFIILLIGGVRWIIAAGDKSALESARGMVTGAIVGLFIILSVWAIIVLIETFFNVNIIRSGQFRLPSAQ